MLCTASLNPLPEFYVLFLKKYIREFLLHLSRTGIRITFTHKYPNHKLR